MAVSGCVWCAGAVVWLCGVSGWCCAGVSWLVLVGLLVCDDAGTGRLSLTLNETLAPGDYAFT